MSDLVLSKFLHVAKEITRAERCFSVDINMHVQETMNLDEAVLKSENFSSLAYELLEQAISNGEAILTNNMITDPSQAPVTNTNFSDLRVVIAIPLAGVGAIYLDQHIRKGVIPREIINKLHRLGKIALEQNLRDGSEEELIAAYEELN